MDASLLDRTLWDLMADAVASRQGPWREGNFCCFSAPDRSLLHRLTVRGVNAATRTLKLRGARVRLKPGDAALWSFRNAGLGLDAAFEGVIEPGVDADTGRSTRANTWRLRVKTLVVGYQDNTGHHTRRFRYAARGEAVAGTGVGA